jgi:hypothetical protein
MRILWFRQFEVSVERHQGPRGAAQASIQLGMPNRLVKIRERCTCPHIDNLTGSLMKKFAMLLGFGLALTAGRLVADE